jgi:type 1 glutamine amidotransferase
MSRLAIWALLGVVALVAAACVAGGTDQGPARPGGSARAARVLVLTRTAGFRHASIPAGVAAIRRLGDRDGFAVDATGDFLDANQQVAHQRCVERGGGWDGDHAAADAERRWPWYGQLVGAWFKHHPAVQPATIHVTDRRHPATASLPATWRRNDEWYDFQTDPSSRVHVLARLDESTYQGGSMGASHPIAWCHTVGGGRALYTALGHTTESYGEPLFLDHLLGAIRWAAGFDAGGCPPGR